MDRDGLTSEVASLGFRALRIHALESVLRAQIWAMRREGISKGFFVSGRIFGAECACISSVAHLIHNLMKGATL